ncbi:ABC transporter ATP-binding protein [uncultured Enterovirga sp.]|uniref:ABC transporter ATP-binding protein n=1 Tax=uncultured Enterovirga sp. TaxID=2026352 RepID=UPI0035CC8F06
MTALLEISDLHGGYGDSDILNGIDLEVRPAEIVTVAGTNGAGKSTLAKAIVGLLPRLRGRIAFRGADLVGRRTEACVQLGIGFVPQVANVFPSLTVAENLQVVSGARDRKARMAELLATFPALAPRLGQRAGSLSGGERQQLAVARALMPRPALLIMDEPTAALSPARVSAAFELIRDLPRLGVAVLLVEQRARQALAISDRGCILDGGKVVMASEAATLLTDGRAAELYLGQARQEAAAAS